LDYFFLKTTLRATAESGIPRDPENPGGLYTDRAERLGGIEARTPPPLIPGTTLAVGGAVGGAGGRRGAAAVAAGVVVEVAFVAGVEVEVVPRGARPQGPVLK